MSQEIKYFFSYAREDSEFVLKLANELRQVGVKLWLDQLDILGGQRWDRAVEGALEACAGMIVVLSPQSLASDNVMDEVAYALDGGKLVVPILLRPGSVPFRLRRVHHIDFTSGYEVGFSHLLRALHVKPPQVTDRPADKTPRTEDSKKSSTAVELPTSEDGRGGKILPFAIGIETLGGVFTKLIPERSSLPVRHAEIFSTASDNQSSVELSVFAGVRPLVKDNLSIGKFQLVGIPPAPRGMPQIEVVFEVDAAGIVNVSAKDLGTGRQQKMTITSLRPSKDEIERILRESQLHSTDDARRIEETETRNRLDSLTYQVEKTITQNRAGVEPQTALAIDTAIADAKKAIKAGSVDNMNSCYNRLEALSHKLAATLYKPNVSKEGTSFRQIFADLFGQDPNDPGNTKR